MSASVPTVGDEDGALPDNLSFIGTAPPYEENKAFNQYFDEECGDVLLRDAIFSPSRILYTFERLTYLDYLEGWRQEQREKFKDIIIEKFPTPIAYNFHRLEYGAQNVSQHPFILRDIWESLIFFLYAVVLGDFRAAGIPMEGTDIKRQALLSNSISTRLSIIRQLLAIASTAGNDLVCADLVSPNVLDDLIELNKVRMERQVGSS